MGMTFAEAVRCGIGHEHPDHPLRGTPFEVKAKLDPAKLPMATPADGPWRLELPDWTPPTVNALMSGHWRKRARVKKAAMVKVMKACRDAWVTRAGGKRRVTITVTVKSRRPDEDNISKAILDGLVKCGALIDDGPQWVESVPRTLNGPKGTVITIEDIPSTE